MRNEIKGLKNVQQDDLIRIVPSENKLNIFLNFFSFLNVLKIKYFVFSKNEKIVIRVSVSYI